MNCLPVIEMEMRSASRRKWTFSLRLLFMGTSAAACLVVLALPLRPSGKGQVMLNLLSYLCLAFSLVAGALLTADCVSSEKRDGTLGLLFLTPLTGLDVVLGKIVCHGLQVFYGICAVFPVFFLPLLAGGVTWSEVSRILLALGLSFMVSASIGMLVSVLGTDSRRTIMASLSAAAVVAALPMLYLLVRGVFLAAPAAKAGLPQFSPVFAVLSGFDSAYRRPAGPALYWGSALILLLTGLALVALSAFLIGRVFRSAAVSRGTSESRRAPPSLPGVLERNPYEWILLRNAAEGQSLGVLTVCLLLFFAAMLVASVATNHWQEGFSAAFFSALAIHILAKFRFAVEATRQLNADHRGGALELLLISPLPERSLMEGHHSALRVIGRKPVILLICVNLLLQLTMMSFPKTLHMDGDSISIFSSLFVGGMALAAADIYTLRWLALLHGLRASSHAKAALVTFISVMLLPWAGVGLVVAWVASAQPRSESFLAIFSFWILSCLVYDLFVVRYARRRLVGFRRLASESS